MGITAIESDAYKSFGDRFLEKLHKGADAASKVGVTLLGEVDGLIYLTDLFLSIVEPLEKLKLIKASEGFTKFSNTVTHLSNFLWITLILYDLQDWFCKDAKGKYLIHKNWHKIAEKAMWTLTHVIDIAKLLAEFNPGFLTRIAVPLQLVEIGIKVVGCTFGIWDNLRTIRNVITKPKYKRLSRKIRKWKLRSNAWSPSERNRITEEKIDKWTNRLSKIKTDHPDKSKETSEETRKRKDAKLKLKQWTFLKSCSKDELIRFCESKAQRLNDIKYNRNLKLGKSISLIAINVAFIALIVLSGISQLTGFGGTLLPFILMMLPIVLSVYDLSHYLLTTLLTTRQLHELDLPV